MNKFRNREKLIKYDLRFSGLTYNEVLSEPDVDKTSDNPLLDAIYGIDEYTGLPSGDFALMLGKDVPEEVRQFVMRNIQVQLPDSPALPAEHEDALFDYIRNSGESVHDYVRRISDFEHERVGLDIKKRQLKKANVDNG